jgi:hypothetical protein
LGRSLGPMGAFGIDFWVSWVKPSTDKQWPWTVHSAACLETELQGWDFLKIEKIKRSWYQVDTLRFASFFEGSTLKFKEIINTWVSRPFLIEARIILQDVPRHCLYCRRDWIITNPWSHPTKIVGQKEPSWSEEQTWRLPDRELQAIGAAAMFHMLCISCSTTTMLECIIHILQTGYHSTSLSVFFSKPAWKGIAYFQRC